MTSTLLYARISDDSGLPLVLEGHVVAGLYTLPTCPCLWARAGLWMLRSMSQLPEIGL